MNPLVDIYNEYLRWLTINDIVISTTNLINNQKKRYELENILERWILTAANYTNDDDDPVLPKNIRELDCTDKMVNEILEKRIFTKEITYDLQNKILNKIETFFFSILSNYKSSKCKNITNEQNQQIYRPKLNIISNNQDSKIIYGNFKFNISSNRLQLLRSFATDEQIATMIIRYSCLLPRGQQWSIPNKIYRKIVEKYDINFEGFASPMNSQLLGILGKNTEFCSLFRDTDACFGSKGSFFTQNLVNKRCIINPPYILDIINRTINYCQIQCYRAKKEEKDILMIIVVPKWIDAEFYQTLLKSEHLIFKLDHQPKSYYFENDNKSILAHFATTWFILGYGSKILEMNFDLSKII